MRRRGKKGIANKGEWELSLREKCGGGDETKESEKRVLKDGRYNRKERRKMGKL